jgi:hypothetical protein
MVSSQLPFPFRLSPSRIHCKSMDQITPPIRQNPLILLASGIRHNTRVSLSRSAVYPSLETMSLPFSSRIMLSGDAAKSSSHCSDCVLLPSIPYFSAGTGFSRLLRLLFLIPTVGHSPMADTETSHPRCWMSQLLLHVIVLDYILCGP